MLPSNSLKLTGALPPQLGEMRWQTTIKTMCSNIGIQEELVGINGWVANHYVILIFVQSNRILKKLKIFNGER